MYIRRTHTRNSATGERYHTHRLVRSTRVGGKVRQITLLNLGRHFAVPPAEWPTLCVRLEELLGGQGVLLKVEISAELERTAQRPGAQPLARQPVTTPAPSPTPEAPTPDAALPPAAPPELDTIEVDALIFGRPPSVGVESVGLWAMAQLEFATLLETLGLNAPDRTAILGAIIARMAAPGSERATRRWLIQTSGLGELLDVDFEAMNLMRVHRASDALLRHRATLEKTLFARVSEVFGLDWTVTLYDLTNTFFEGEAAANLRAKHAHSKEKRSDCALVTPGLVLDGSGFVRRSEVFDGNVVEGATLEGMLAGLGAPAGALVVMDRGIATEENVAWLRAQGYRYLVVSRERQRRFDADAAIWIRSAGGDPVAVQRVLDAAGEEVRLYCCSERRAHKEDGIAERFCTRFEAALQALHEGLARPRTTKRITTLWERIGRLKETSHGVGQHYNITVKPDAGGVNAQAIRWERRPVDGTFLTHPGVYCLRTNALTWDSEQLWRTDVMLTDLEAVFRSLKSELGLRPVYHQTAERAEGHLFITVLAYQFVQIIRRRLQVHGITERWSTLRAIFAGQCRVTATFRRPDGRALHVRKATQPEPAHLAIIRALGSDPTPGCVQKIELLPMLYRPHLTFRLRLELQPPGKGM